MRRDDYQRVLSGIGLALLLGACGVNARPDRDSLTFQDVEGWNYLGKAPDGLLEQFKKDNGRVLKHWAGDPRRFLVHSADRGTGKPLYIINPRVDCPAWGCPEDPEIYWNNYSPFCEVRKRYCLLIIYTRENRRYLDIFSEHFGYQGDGEGNFLRVSQQTRDGLPLCFEVKGISLGAENAGKLPPIQEGERYISRYCYDGQEYTLSNVYTERWDWLTRETENERRK